MCKIQRFCPEPSVFLVIVLVQTVRNSLCSSCEWAIERSCQEGAGGTSKKKYTKVFRKCSRDTFSVVNISMNAERNFHEEIHQSFWEVFAGHTFILSICCLLSIFQLIFSLVCLFLIVVWNYESIRRLWANDAKMLMMIAKIWRIV